jgi:carboxyl-terminal processing protease
LQQRHEERVKTNAEFQRFVEDVDALAKQRDKATISLNENERRAEIEAAAKRARVEGENGDDGSVDDGLQANERSLSDELAREKARKSAKDALQDEAASIVIDLADLTKSRPE